MPLAKTHTLQDQVRVQIDYTPHPGQAVFHRSPARIRVLACGARWGKDRASVNEAIKLALALWNERRSKRTPLTPLVHVWFVAPTYELLRQNWREFRKFIPTSLISRQNESLHFLELCDGDVVVEFKSADHPDSLVSVGLDVLLITEAGMIDPIAWEQSLQPRLVSPGRTGYAIVNGTPKGKQSWFEALYLQGQDPLIPHIDSWNRPSFDNPYIDKQELAALARTMPERWYQQEIMAVFLDDAGGVFHNVLGCVDHQATLLPPVRGHDYVLGVDLAKLHDFTVIVVIDLTTRAVVHFDRFHQLDWKIQKERIRRCALRYYNAPILLDATAHEPILEDLRFVGLIAEGYHFTAPSKKICIDALIIAIEQAQISYPFIAQLISELQAYQYVVTKNSSVGTAPTKMSAPRNFFDDCVIALALAWWHASQLGLFAVDATVVSIGASRPPNAYDLANSMIQAVHEARTADDADAEDDEEYAALGLEVAVAATNRPTHPVHWWERIKQARGR